ncbi:MAG: type I-E CRISPR-associated protein Cas7/Cse4/CasC, partial [bacterium]|nr:type I-E CRISPR-associated protein Cas7/Cse4/CasC [bacterium]
MIRPRFLQIHTLTSYAAALLNRDDSGLAKRLPYGDALRTRISSQCLKRHWRIANDPHALDRIDGVTAAFRSRELVTRKVIGSLRESFSDDVVAALETEFQLAVYGDKGGDRKSRQTLLLGEPELKWLEGEARDLAQRASGDAKAVAVAAQEWRKDFRSNIKAMRESAALPAGLVSALFGRMVTSDPDANIAAPVHVAHAFTVHEEEPESDYFTAVDDLSEDEPGADTIQETELTSGLFYGYVVVDLQGNRFWIFHAAARMRLS